MNIDQMIELINDHASKYNFELESQSEVGGQGIKVTRLKSMGSD